MSWSGRLDDPLPPAHPEQPPLRVTNLVKSVVRTWAPMLVGAVVTWLATHWGILVPQGLPAEATALLAGAVMAGYYAAARWLEERRGYTLPARAARWLGRWLLGGVIAAPNYPRR